MVCNPYGLPIIFTSKHIKYYRHVVGLPRKVDALIVELHERVKPGCERSFYNATKGFDDVWMQGKNVYVTRSEGCLTRRST